MPYQETGLALPARQNRGVRLCPGWSALPALSLALLLLALAVAVALTTTPFVSQPRLAPDAPKAPILQAGLDLESGAPTWLATSGKTVERWHDARVLLVEPGSWTQHSYTMVDQALALLPTEVRAQLGNPVLGPLYVSVNREGRTLSGAQPYQRAANFFSTNEGRSEIVLFPDQSPRTAMHELGHAYNLRNAAAGSYAQVFASEEMKSFLKASQWRVLTPASELRELRDHADVQVVYEGPPVWSRLSRDDPLEDFANSFALYFTAPAELKAISPARFTWFAQHFRD
ncbi:MAG TPA: hypothetical protein VJB57_03605 [Dehalococcoidia bacterium]|nr:hypothetical protein [Dehalococcoidia bacterium]